MPRALLLISPLMHCPLAEPSPVPRSLCGRRTAAHTGHGPVPRCPEGPGCGAVGAAVGRSSTTGLGAGGEPPTAAPTALHPPTE